MSHRNYSPGYIYFTAVCCFLFTMACDNKQIQAPDSKELISTFQLADGFQIELIAAEPLISDPVDMEIDENGRMYVVEMHGYPLDKSGSGNVKLLVDDDGDGTMDRSVLFADDLKFPTGVMRWKQGILVSDPPNVLYFEDTDGDGQADIRDTMLTGFAVSNPQHNVNNPMYAIDNWIYISNEPAVVAKVYTEEFNDLGSEVHFYNSPNSQKLPTNSGGRRMRMRPDMEKLELTSSRSQFGHTTDRWGHHFLTSNANHIFQEVIQETYLERNPQLLLSNSTEVISDHGAAAEVYPITVNPEHQLLTDLGVFTSACGITAYSGGLFPDEYQDAVFTAEPVGNLVHVDVVDNNGIAFTASRKFEQKEFLASKDPWFRPVNHYVGPDGALYVVDYYRRIIEHPEWMGEETINSGHLYDGVDQGRIYRITPRGTAPANWTQNLDFGKLSDQELIPFLEDDNTWYRLNAQRLLIDRANAALVGDLVRFIPTSKSSTGRLHAAWTLEGLGQLKPEMVIELMKDPEAGLRENAIVLSEPFLDEDQVLQALITLENDPDIRVRFQLLCTLGAVDNPAVVTVRNRMVMKDIGERWMQVAALSSSAPKTDQLLNLSITHYQKNEEAYQQFIRSIVSVITASHDIDEIQKLIRQALKPTGTRGDEWRASIIQGMVTGTRNMNLESTAFNPERNLLVNSIFSDPSDQVRSASLDLLRHLGLPQNSVMEQANGKALASIRDKNQSEANRARAIGFIAFSNLDGAYGLLEDLLVPSESNRIQRAALNSMYAIKGNDFIQVLIDKWTSMTPELRDEAVRILLSVEEGRRKLIEALESKIIDPSAIKWPQRVGMMAQADDELRKRSRIIFTAETTDEEKQALLDNYKKAAGLESDVNNGLKVFETNCAICHQIGGEFGTAYGPDLASIRNRKPESIIQDILDPGLSIADGYELWEVTMKNGDIKQGIIGSETGNSITLRVLGIEDEIISRETIERLESKTISVMPAGLENQIDVQSMADLLTFIKQLK